MAAGSCNTTDYTCKCKLGRAGKACEFCKYDPRHAAILFIIAETKIRFGYKFVGGICLKTDFNMPDLSLLQVATAVRACTFVHMRAATLELSPSLCAV